MGLLRGDFKMFLVVGHIPVKFFPVSHFFDATHANNWSLFKGETNFH